MEKQRNCGVRQTNKFDVGRKLLYKGLNAVSVKQNGIMLINSLQI